MLKKPLFAAFALTVTAVADEHSLEKQETHQGTTVTETSEKSGRHAEEKKEPSSKEEKQGKKTKEHTVKAAPFTIESEVSGILVPTKVQTLKLSPKRWKSFSIESIAQHGAEIKKGEPLLVFKTKAIDKNLVEQEQDLKSKGLKVAIANRELTELQQTNALALASAKRRMEHAEADLAYYKSTGLSARKESLAQALQQTEDFLSYQKEELTQLLKMYEEDDITEETEEIILTRQKANVRNAENNLSERKRQNARSLETTLPRELISYQDKVENARISYATAKLNLERKYGLKKLEVAKLERSLTDAQEALAETQEDRKLFDVLAEFDGNLLFGEFTNGQWKKGKTPEFLKDGGTVPPRHTVLTFVAKDSPLALHALMATEKVAELQTSLKESGDAAPKVEIAAYPDMNGKHLIALAEQAPKDFQFPGQKEKSELVFYHSEQAITIPNAAIKTKEDGSSYVMLKLSEGDPEERAIKLGKKDENVTEILSGLEEGQVILH